MEIQVSIYLISIKKTLTYIREKNLWSRQFTCTCSNNKSVFIKNDVRILKSNLRVAARKSFVFVPHFMKKNLYFGIVIFWVGGKHCIVFPES